ncbi:MAG: LCP family protein [Candidatus Saganbacteria bacterium]|nr:LCP family protein [Candidatus Saganbacteria bacterium]
MKKIVITFVVIAIFVAATGGFLFAIASKFALFEIFVTLTPTEPLLAKTNILVLGVDDAFGHRADTIMVLHTNPQYKEASLISIPRDTLAVLPGRGLDKINHAYAYGGIELTRETVEELLKIEIPYYIAVNLSGITNMIDELGGIDIEVEKRMYYVDYAGGLNIDLKPGYQKLSGKQAMGYLRYRLDGGDFSRINRQQKFLRSFASEMLRRENILQSPKLFLTLTAYLDTNLTSKETLGLALALRSAYELGQVYMTTLPGTDIIVDGIYYWKLDKKGLLDIVKQFIYGEKTTS